MVKKKDLIKHAFEPDHPEKVKIKDAFGELTEQSIFDYWKSVEPEFFPILKGKPIMLFIQTDGQIVRKRNTDEGTPIVINTSEDYDRWIATGGTVSVHLVYPEKMTNIAHVELDPKEGFPFDKVKQTTAELYDLFENQEFVKDISLRYSGSRGFYLILALTESTDLNAVRGMLNEILEGYIESKGDPSITTKATKEPNSMRLDTSTNMSRGTLRAPYSLHENTGLVSIPLTLDKLKGFEKEQAKPELKVKPQPKAQPELNLKDDSRVTAQYWAQGLVKAGALDKLKPGYTGRFVINEHLAKHAGRHWDLRLEAPGELDELYEQKREFDKSPEPEPKPEDKTVLESWAVRNLDQLLEDKKDKVLAVHVEPHPISYISFEGEIPSGYGAGTVSIYDQGTWEVFAQDAHRIKFKLHGTKMADNIYFVLIHTRDNQWLLIKSEE